MTPTKLLVGQISIVFAIVLLGLWAATQWAAAMLAYQPRLGAPWFEIAALPVYRPGALFGWWYHYEAYAPAVFNKAGAWVEQKLAILGDIGSDIVTGLKRFLDSLSWTDIFHLGDVWDRAKRIFTDPISRLISFAGMRIY